MFLTVIQWSVRVTEHRDHDPDFLWSDCEGCRDREAHKGGQTATQVKHANANQVLLGRIEN